MIRVPSHVGGFRVVRRRTVLVDVDAFELAFLGDPQDAGALTAVHDDEGDDEGGDRRSTALPQICAQSCAVPPPQNRPLTPLH